MWAGGRIEMPDAIANPSTRDRYYVNSLVEEAITSSQLEGAGTTRRVAKEMLRTHRPPADRAERMILNNYLAMQRIGEVKDEAMSPELLLELHRIVASETLDSKSQEGRLRRADEDIVVGDLEGNVYHSPPPAATLPERLEAMCAFANAVDEVAFVHPVIRAIALHFWLAYDHPFVDGNGRTARALFYWSMLHSGFWLFEFVSISTIIRKAKGRYLRAFLDTESDDNDLTYFLLYHLDVIREAIDSLNAFIRREAERVQALSSRLRGFAVLNHRQKALVEHALRHPDQVYTIQSHQNSHNVVYQTARTDLMALERWGLLRSYRVGKAFQYRAAPDLEARLGVLVPQGSGPEIERDQPNY
jgi:Fic family protein